MIKLALICGCLMFVGCPHGQTTNTSARQTEVQRSTPSPDVSLDPSAVVLKISFDGGLVQGDRTGHHEFVVTRAGNYSRAGDVDRIRKGVLSIPELDELIQDINSADYVALKSKAFTGTCPSAYDGDEVTYTFYTQKGVEVISSCKFEIDMKSAVFKKVWEIQNKYIK